MKMTTTQAVRCLIVDDEALARELIENHLAQLPNYELVASCASAIEAREVLNQEHVDLMFLDIEMPVLKGTEFYKNLLNKPKVIFTTAYRDYALDGFELDAVDYLLKPVVFSRFFKALERFSASHFKTPEVDEPNLSDKLNLNQKQTQQADHIFVRKDRKQVKICLDEIVYIQSVKDYIKIIIDVGSIGGAPNGVTSHLIKERIGAFEQQLGDAFLRVHRSYIVNKDKVTAFTKHDVELGDHEIPIGDNYRHQFEAVFG